tara:strand:+ start:781 stop:912 length:132 start_codon:yes stop_codon:yes gene_type:complete
MGFEVLLGLGIAGLAWNYLQGSISNPFYKIINGKINTSVRINN